MSDSRKKTQGASRALPEQSKEERRAFDEWWNPIVSGVEAAPTYIEKLRFLDTFDLLELDGIRYFKLQQLCERVENEALDQIRTEAKAKATAEEKAEYLANVRHHYDFKHNFHYKTFQKLEKELNSSEPDVPHSEQSGNNYQRPSWQEVIEKADALPTLEEQIAYLEWVKKEDRINRMDFRPLVQKSGKKEPAFRDKLDIEIGYRKKLLKESSHGSEQEAETNPDPLHWQGTQEQLAYLIYLLKDAGLIKSGRHWKQAAKSFVDEEGNPYKSEQLKSIAGSLGFSAGGSSSTRAHELDKFVSDVQDQKREDSSP